MFDINARFLRKEPDFEAKPCVVEKVVRLSGTDYDSFSRNMLRDFDFIRDNKDSMFHDENGKLHCLMVVGEGRPDGILVHSSGYDYARYAALLPGAGDTLPAMRFPALAELNRKLEMLVEHIVEHVSQEAILTDTARLNIEDLEAQFHITLDKNMLATVQDMLATKLENGGLVIQSLTDVHVSVGDKLQAPMSFDQFVSKYRMMDEACRQWCDFIDEAPERRDGTSFTEFYQKICNAKYQEYLEDPAYQKESKLETGISKDENISKPSHCAAINEDRKKQSIKAQLEAARKNPAKPKDKEQPPKSKGGPEL